ncbi:glycosyltransferase [Rothia terrae]|uniref:glycosyltransferase n=1 Tax=Rothia terrae TaxID=396015 RepID=UPI0033FF6256
MALKKALWVVPVGNFGGVARHVVDVATAGLPGYELVVLAPEGELADAVRRTGTRVIADSSFGVDAGFKSSYASLYKVVEDEQPDVVHTHLAYADIVGAAVITALRARKKLRKTHLTVPQLATTEHGIAQHTSVYNKNQARGAVIRVAHSARMLVTPLKIAVSHSTAEQMKKQWGARKVTVVHNGVDAPLIQAGVERHRVQSKQSGPRVLSLSRLAPEKGLTTLIDAFAQVRQQYPDASLEIAGSGELEHELRARVERLKLSDSVRFSGFVDPLEAMGRNDVVVQLSVWENLSYTLLDAKAAGLSVVASNVGGNSEILEAAELVSPLDHGKQNDSEIAQAIVTATQYAHQPFNWQSVEEMTHQTAALYTQIMKNMRGNA